MEQPPGPVSLVTERLVLRTPRPGDFAAMVAIWTDPVLARFMGDFGPRTVDEVREWVTAQAKVTEPPTPDGSMNLAVARTVDGQVVGWVGLGRESAGGDAWDFAYATHPEHRGHRYATEALTAAVGYVLDVLGVPRVWGRCDQANPASAAVMLGAGLVEGDPADGDRYFSLTRDP